MRRKLAGTQECYQVKNSILFYSSLGQYLSRTPAASDPVLTKATLYFCLKRGSLGTFQMIADAYSASGAYSRIYIDTNNKICIDTNNVQNKISNAPFRDIASHYHIVIAFDTTLATATDRAKVWVNGKLLTWATDTAIAQNATIYFNTNAPAYIGRSAAAAQYYLDAYLSEFLLATGQALDQSHFGRKCPFTGEWEPIKPRVSDYGTNGFFMEFKNAAALGTDTSGKGNNWTTNGGIVAANQFTDTPTNNYPVWNILRSDRYSGTLPTFYQGNLNAMSYSTNSDHVMGYSTFKIPASGNWYAEVYFASKGNWPAGYSNQWHIGVVDSTLSPTLANPTSACELYNQGDTIGIAINANTRTVQYYKNGVYLSGQDKTYLAGIDAYLYCHGTGNGAGSRFLLNCGQRPFTYAPPTGFKALCTSNLPTPSIKRPDKFFKALLYTGSGAAKSVADVAGASVMQPDLVWIKSRTAATDHALYDSVRGATKDLASNLTAAETTQAQGLTSFDANGFSLGTLAKLHTLNASYVAWCWKKGITPGFDVVEYTGNGVNRTIPHGLGQAPALMIIKNRNNAGGVNWAVWHKALSATEYLLLNSTNAKATLAAMWNSTAPTSSEFSLGTDANVNAVYDHVACLFAEVPGFSKFGSYVGNGSTDGPFVHCGFKPAYILIKSTASARSWYIHDSKTEPNNPESYWQRADGTDAETALAGILDITSNGFKIRHNTAPWNQSGETHIFMAFAEIPTKYALAR